MAKSEITVKIADLPEVQEVFRRIREKAYADGFRQGEFDALADIATGRVECPCCRRFHGGDER